MHKIKKWAKNHISELTDVFLILLIVIVPVVFLFNYEFKNNKIIKEITLIENTTIENTNLCVIDNDKKICHYKFNNDKTVPLEFDIASKYQSFTFNKITVEVYENKNYIIGYYTTNDAINSTFKVKLFSMYQGYMYYEMYHIK